MPGLTQASHVSQHHWISVLSNLASFKCNYKGPAHLGKLSGQNAQPPATSAQAAALPGSTLRAQCRGLQVFAYTCACSGVPAPVSHTYTFMSPLAPGRCVSVSYQMTGYTYVFYTRKMGQGGSLVLPSGLRFCGFCPQGVP